MCGGWRNRTWRAVVDDSSVNRAQYLQQLLISLNREIARQMLQGPLVCTDALAAPEPECDRAEAQDLYQVEGALDPKAMLTTASAVTSAADAVGDVVMCGHANAPTVNNAPPVDNAPADVSMQEAEPWASDSTTIMLFVRRATSSDTLPVYIGANASVDELEAQLQTYHINASKYVLLFGGAPLRRDATLAAQGIHARSVIVYHAQSER